MPCEVCWLKTPDFGCPPVMAPQGLEQVMGEKRAGQRVDVSFSYYVMNSFFTTSPRKVQVLVFVPQ